MLMHTASHFPGVRTFSGRSRPQSFSHTHLQKVDPATGLHGILASCSHEPDALSPHRLKSTACKEEFRATAVSDKRLSENTDTNAIRVQESGVVAYARRRRFD